MKNLNIEMNMWFISLFVVPSYGNCPTKEQLGFTSDTLFHLQNQINELEKVCELTVGSATLFSLVVATSQMLLSLSTIFQKSRFWISVLLCLL